MYTVNVHPTNAENVKRMIQTAPAENNHGYTAAIAATMYGHNYLIESLEGVRPLFILTFTDEINTRHVIALENATPDSIEIRNADTYKNATNYGKHYTAEKYLKKYNLLACMVHGLYVNGLLTA